MRNIFGNANAYHVTTNSNYIKDMATNEHELSSRRPLRAGASQPDVSAGATWLADLIPE
jgi:hypothetical protein